jgi:hypothetical protein
MESRGGETGGLTILEVLRDYEERGYQGQFAAREGGVMKCFSCGARNEPTQVRMDSLRRVEGASDPADMVLIGALRCPGCGAKGTATFKYGSDTTPADSDAMRLIEDVRACMQPQSATRDVAHVPEVGLDFNPEQRGPGM